MLRITTIVSGTGTTLKVEGRIVSEGVEELRRACDAALRPRRRLRLELTGVTFVDTAALRALRTVIDQRAEIVGCSLYVSGLLGQTP